MNRVLVVAEVGDTHQGKIDRALALIRAAKKAGADFVKFQHYNPDLLSHRDSDGYASLVKNRIPNVETWKRLCHEAKLAGIDLCISMFDTELLDMFIQMNVRAFKIASSELTNLSLIRAVAKRIAPHKGYKLIISTGMSTSLEVTEASVVINTAMAPMKAEREVFLLHCVSAYPTPNDQANMRAIAVLKSFGNSSCYRVGYSDHTRSPHAFIMAIALGAEMIEWHLTLEKGHKYALTPSELRKRVEIVRACEVELGHGGRLPMPCEIPARNRFRRGPDRAKR